MSYYCSWLQDDQSLHHCHQSVSLQVLTLGEDRYSMSSMWCTAGLTFTDDSNIFIVGAVFYSKFGVIALPDEVLVTLTHYLIQPRVTSTTAKIWVRLSPINSHIWTTKQRILINTCSFISTHQESQVYDRLLWPHWESSDHHKLFPTRCCNISRHDREYC